MSWRLHHRIPFDRFKPVGVRSLYAWMRLPRRALMDKFDDFMLFSNKLIGADQEWSKYSTDREVEARSHRGIFVRSWVKSSSNPLLEGSNRDPTPANDMRVRRYFNGWDARLTRQSQSLDPFETEVSLGARECLRQLYKEAKGSYALFDLVLAHCILLDLLPKDRRNEYTRFYPDWYVACTGFERKLSSRSTTATDPKTRMQETGLTDQIARSALKVGDRPPKQIDGAAHCLNRFLNETNTRHLITLAPVVCNIGASFETSRPHLERFSAPLIGRGDATIIRSTLEECYQTLGLTEIPWITATSIACARINPDANPGVLWGQLYATRSHAYEATTTLAIAMFEELRYRPYASNFPWSVGGREKRQERTVGEKVTSRLVQMPEDAYNRLEGAIAEPLLERFKWIKKDLCLGMSYANGNYRRDFKIFDACVHVKTFDWKSFDSTINRRLIVSAFAILRACFPSGEHVDNVFGFLLSGFMHRNVVCPGGDIVHLSRGVPSGSGFTSLVGSVINWLIFRTVLRSFHGPNLTRRVHLRVLGDDSKLGYPFVINDIPSNKTFLAEASRLWGMVAGEDAPGVVSEGFNTSAWLSRCQPFLSVRSHMGLPSWSLRDYCVTELGYRKGQPKSYQAQYAWFGLMGFPAFGHSIHALWEPFMEWCNKQPDSARFNDGWVEETTNFLYSFMALTMADLSDSEEVGMFIWGRKGRYFSEWTTKQVANARNALNPYDQETKVRKRGATRHALSNTMVTLDGRSAWIDPWSAHPHASKPSGFWTPSELRQQDDEAWEDVVDDIGPSVSLPVLTVGVARLHIGTSQFWGTPMSQLRARMVTARSGLDLAGIG